MTAKEIFELRKQGQVEVAYEAARQLYATDKGTFAASAMFWTAVDMLRQRTNEGKTDEAKRILLALERLYPNVPDREGWAVDALRRCQQLLGKTPATPSEPTDKKREQTEMGKWGEEVAKLYLYRKGYDLVNQDWHSGHRDIDIIVQRGPLVVFVEVKARCTRDFGDPLDAIDYQKRYNLRRSISHYVNYHHIEQFRFDIITVVGPLHSDTPDIHHYEDVNIMEQEHGRPRRRNGF